MGTEREIESAVDEPGAPYDSRAAVFDRMVRSPLYNRIAWSTSPAAYEAFAAEAAGAGDGPLLEAAAGSAAATAAVHAGAGRETVLADRSRAMLERAAARIDEAGREADVRLVQADLFELPFPPGGFETVLALGAAHLFEDVPAFRDALLAQLRPGGSLYIAGLVGETRRGRAYLRALHRAGEIATPRTAAELRAALEPDDFRLDGCMAFAVIGAPGS